MRTPTIPDTSTTRGARLVKRERGRYAVIALRPERDSPSWQARELGEIRRETGGRAWRHLLAPEREFYRLRDAAVDLVETTDRPDTAMTSRERRAMERAYEQAMS